MKHAGIHQDQYRTSKQGRIDAETEIEVEGYTSKGAKLLQATLRDHAVGEPVVEKLPYHLRQRYEGVPYDAGSEED